MFLSDISTYLRETVFYFSILFYLELWLITYLLRYYGFLKNGSLIHCCVDGFNCYNYVLQIFLELFLQWMPCFLQRVVYILTVYTCSFHLRQICGKCFMGVILYVLFFKKWIRFAHLTKSSFIILLFSRNIFFDNTLLDRFCYAIILSLSMVWYFFWKLTL